MDRLKSELAAATSPSFTWIRAYKATKKRNA